MKQPKNDRQQEELGPRRSSQLFLLRVWRKSKTESRGPEALAGRVQDPVSGQVQYFSGEMELVRILRRTISQEDESDPAGVATNKPDSPAPTARTLRTKSIIHRIRKKVRNEIEIGR